MSCSGTGFIMLRFKNRPLAYLRVLKDVPPPPNSDQGGLLKLQNYEILGNAELWEEFLLDYQGENKWTNIATGIVYASAFAHRVRDGSLQLIKLVKSPSIKTRGYQYFPTETTQYTFNRRLEKNPLMFGDIEITNMTRQLLEPAVL